MTDLHFQLASKRKSYVKKRWRVAISAVRFSIKMEHIREDQQWGHYVEKYTHSLLLECDNRLIPDSYFRAMPSANFPPGWVLKNFQPQLKNQIETFAKNKIVRLLLPRARLQATRRNIQRQTQVAKLRHSDTLSSADCLSRNNAFFSTWNRSLLDELFAASTVRTYPQGWWLTPCSKNPFDKCNAFLILEGSVQTFDSLITYKRFSKLSAIASDGTRKEGTTTISATEPNTAENSPSCMSLLNVNTQHHHVSVFSGRALTLGGGGGTSHCQHQKQRSNTITSSASSGNTHHTNSPRGEGRNSLIDPIFSASIRTALECIDSSRAVLKTPIRKGHVAKTSVTVLEIPFQLLNRLSMAHIQNTLTCSANAGSLRSYLQTNLLSQMTDFLPLNPVTFQSNSEYFRKWSVEDVTTMLSSARPKVAFKKESLLSSSVWGRANEFIVIARGKATLTQHFRHLAANNNNTNNNQQQQRNQQMLEDDETFLSIPCGCSITLSFGDTFGEDFVVFDDACGFTLCADSDVVEYYSIPRQALVANLKNTNAKREELDRARQKREALMARMKPTRELILLLATHSHFLRVPCETLKDIVDAMLPCVVNVADRLVSVGDDMEMLFAMLRGKLNVLLLGTEHVHEQQSHLEGTPDSAFAATAAGEGGAVIKGGIGGSKSPVFEQQQSFAHECLVGEGFLLKRAKWKWSYSAARLCEGWIISRNHTWAILKANGVAHIVTQNIKSEVRIRQQQQLQRGSMIDPRASLIRMRNNTIFTHRGGGERCGVTENDPNCASSFCLKPAPPETPSQHIPHAIDERMHHRKERILQEDKRREKVSQQAHRKLQEERDRVRPSGRVTEIFNRLASRGNDCIGIGKQIEPSSKMLYDRAKAERLKIRQQQQEHRKQQNQNGGGFFVPAPPPPPPASRILTSSSNVQFSQQQQHHTRPFVKMADGGGLDLILPQSSKREVRSIDPQQQASSTPATSSYFSLAEEDKLRQIEAQVDEHLRRQQRKLVSSTSEAVLEATLSSKASPHPEGNVVENQSAMKDQAPFISVSRAEKAVIKSIMLSHKQKIKEQRRECFEMSSIESQRQLNPFSSLHRRSTKIPRVTQFGALYFDPPPSKQTNINANSEEDVRAASPNRFTPEPPSQKVRGNSANGSTGSQTVNGSSVRHSTRKEQNNSTAKHKNMDCFDSSRPMATIPTSYLSVHAFAASM